jgi:hypothetical protein
VAAPDGSRSASLARHQDGLLVADLDLNLCRQVIPGRGLIPGDLALPCGALCTSPGLMDLAACHRANVLSSCTPLALPGRCASSFKVHNFAQSVSRCPYVELLEFARPSHQQTRDKWGFQMTSRPELYAELLARYVRPDFVPQVRRMPFLPGQLTVKMCGPLHPFRERISGHTGVGATCVGSKLAQDSVCG